MENQQRATDDCTHAQHNSYHRQGFGDNRNQINRQHIGCSHQKDREQGSLQQFVEALGRHTFHSAFAIEPKAQLVVFEDIVEREDKRHDEDGTINQTKNE